MRSFLRYALLLSLVASAAGCRQPDGPIPTPTADQSNEIGDIARNMTNIANKDPQAPDDLRNDLGKYADNEEAAQRIDRLVGTLAKALAGTRLTDEAAQSLAKVLWVGLNGTELSERQADALARDVRSVLSETGMSEESAQTIADQLGEAQRAVSENRRSWYQVF